MTPSTSAAKILETNPGSKTAINRIDEAGGLAAAEQISNGQLQEGNGSINYDNSPGAKAIILTIQAHSSCGDPEVKATVGGDNMVSKQLVLRSSNEQEEQGNADLDKNIGVRRIHSKNNLGAELITIQAHSSNAPVLHFSNPKVEKIIKNAQNEMMMEAAMVKQPLVTLNTSVHDIPSQSVESFGEFEGESGQLMISTGNNNEIIRANVRDMVAKSKLWKEQREEDDEEDWGWVMHLDSNLGFYRKLQN